MIPIDIMLEKLCLSGGADGADVQWGMVAGLAGHAVRHFVFAGHRSTAPEEEKIVLTKDQLEVADAHLYMANKTMKRRWPIKNQFVANLLRRNYYQVAWSDSVYAVASIENGMVTGGTCWAVQMFLDRFGFDPAPAYVFDQATDRWMTWSGTGWEECPEVPVPNGVWAGIGSRDLKVNGKMAIRNLLGYVKPDFV